jgi:hypothetical protein
MAIVNILRKTASYISDGAERDGACSIASEKRRMDLNPVYGMCF